MAKCHGVTFRFDVHGFTEDSQQDETGIQEAAQLCEFSNSSDSFVAFVDVSVFLLFVLFEYVELRIFLKSTRVNCIRI